MKDLRVNPLRLKADFDTLAAIGSTGDGGVHRPALSEVHLAARAWFRRAAEEAGLEFRVDSAGNNSAVLSCGKDGPTLLLGSHLDSVPNGGRFDGALGVVAALEVLRVIKESSLSMNVNLEAIDFTDEEGTLVGLLGSFALAGKLKPKALEAPRGGRDNLLAGLARAGLTEEGLLSAKRDSAMLAGYLELHIEQGLRLVNSRVDIGIVSAIVGICSYKLTFTGRADHAGTIGMAERLDAGQGASAFNLAAREIVTREFPDCVVNIGKMEYEPGAFNIVPERATLALEFRSPEREQFKRLEAALLDAARSSADGFKLGLEAEFLGKHNPAPMSEQAQAAFEAACDALNLSHARLASGAGHDAQSLADICAAGMIFVPSVGGASHSAREFTEWEDCVNGANVLLHAALAMGGVKL